MHSLIRLEDEQIFCAMLVDFIPSVALNLTQKAIFICDGRQFVSGTRDRRSDMPEKDKNFIIKDKDNITKDTDKTATSSDNPADGPDAGQEADRQPADEAAQLPQINFSTFIFSLNSSALVQLGIIEDPASGKKQTNLPLAKQTIDLLILLQEKTKGNLSQDELQLLEHILYDLRIKYIKARK